MKGMLVIRRWGCAALVFLAGLAVFAWKVRIIGSIEFLGLADPAGYAGIAQSILSGRGFEADYISLHFLKFPAGISHPEETWPPLYPCLIVPFFFLFGSTAFAAKLPSLLLSCFALPLVTFALAKRVSRSDAVALASAGTVLLYEPLFTWSLCAMADVTFGCFILLSVLCALKGFDRPRWFYGMGGALALSYYAKTAALVLFFVFIAYYLFWRAARRPRWRWINRDLHFCLAFLLLAILLLPWFVRNYVQFGDPLYSSHKHVAGYVGMEHWEEKTLDVYWDKEPPSLADKFSKPGRLGEKILQSLVEEIRLLFLQKDSRIFVMEELDLPSLSFSDLSVWWIGLPALLGVLLLTARGIFGLALRFTRRASHPKDTRRMRALHALESFAPMEYVLFLLLGIIHLALISILWATNNRYNTPLIPLVFIMGWSTLHHLAKRFIPWRQAGPILVIAAFLIWAGHEGGDLLYARKAGAYPWKEGGAAPRSVAKWIRNHAPGSVIMARHPWGVHFYSGQKAVQLPFVSWDRLRSVADYYKVTHILIDVSDPSQAVYPRDPAARLRPACRFGTLTLFERLPE